LAFGYPIVAIDNQNDIWYFYAVIQLKKTIIIPCKMTLSSKSRHSKPPTIRIPVQSCIEQGFVIEFVEAVMKVIVKGRENRDQLEIFSIECFA